MTHIIDQMAAQQAKSATWYSRNQHEFYWSAAQQEPRRLSLFQYNAEAEALDLGAAGTWGYAWYDIDDQGFASEAEARAAAMAAAPAYWGALTPMEV